MSSWTTGSSGVPTGWTVIDDSQDYLHHYLTIVSLENNNTIGWIKDNGAIAKTIDVSTDDGNTWTSYTSNTNGVNLATLSIGQKMLIKGYNSAFGDINGDNYFTSTGEFNLEGNIMSLQYDNDFIGQTSLKGTMRNFTSLFKGTDVVSAENLILPATTLKSSCYSYMFSNCTSLIKAPMLPATQPIDNCYRGMFGGCTSLTTAPDLLAPTVGYMAYSHMFYNCSSLNYIKCLATNIQPDSTTGEYQTEDWVYGVPYNNGTFVKDPSMTNWESFTLNCGCPFGWTVIDA